MKFDPRETDDLAPELSDDMLRGADSIAEFVFGEQGHRRQVYHLAETSRLPVFRLGSRLCARKSVLLQWIATQEARGGAALHPAGHHAHHLSGPHASHHAGARPASLLPPKRLGSL